MVKDLDKMAASDGLRCPKKKKGSGNFQRDSPLPIPIASLTEKPASKERWYHYFGTLKGEMVAVEKLGDMTFLYRMGFFGKGSLSQSKIEFDQFGNTFDERHKRKKYKKNTKKLLLEEKDFKEIELSTIHKERPKEHKQLSLQISSKTELPTKESQMENLDQGDEFLQLSLEEAFFLSFGLGCLTISEPDKQPLTISELWNKFQELKPRFLETYATYHYFRSMGWIVRDGIIYGSDFILYKEGMPYYHSSYVVFSYLVDEDQIGGTEHSHPWAWSYLTCINRVAEHVAKEVLLSLVIKPKDITEEELSSPRCLERFEVQEILLRRWIPEKHREGKKES